jgi:hypothetical protein
VDAGGESFLTLQLDDSWRPASVTEMPATAFGRAWLAMTLALAAHVTDEALTGFLDDYNPIVLAARERFGWFPMPTFAFGSWLTGLILLILGLLALTPLASDGAWLTRVLAFPFGIIIGLMNGLGHLVASIYFNRWMPGTTTAPILIICGTWLLVSNAGGRRSVTAT